MILVACVQVGDIVVTSDKGAQILVDPSLADYICDNLTQVRVPIDAIEFESA